MPNTVIVDAPLTDAQNKALVTISKLSDESFGEVVGMFKNMPTILPHAEIIRLLAARTIKELTPDDIRLISAMVLDVAQRIFNRGWLRDEQFYDYIANEIYSDLESQIGEHITEEKFRDRFAKIFSVDEIRYQLMAVRLAIQAPNTFSGTDVQSNIKTINETPEIVGAILLYDLKFSYFETPEPEGKRDIHLTFDINDIQMLIRFLQNIMQQYVPLKEKIAKMEIPLYTMKEEKGE